MNISKFTQKSVQAVQDLEKVAYEYGNQEIEEEHLLYALLTQEDSLILKLIEKMEIQKEYFIDTVKKALDAKVKVSSIEERFNVASFGLMGYEMDVTNLSSFDRAAVKKQDRKSTRLNSSHDQRSRMPSSA